MGILESVSGEFLWAEVVWSRLCLSTLSWRVIRTAGMTMLRWAAPAWTLCQILLYIMLSFHHCSLLIYHHILLEYAHLGLHSLVIISCYRKIFLFFSAVVVCWQECFLQIYGISLGNFKHISVSVNRLLWTTVLFLYCWCFTADWSDHWEGFNLIKIVHYCANDISLLIVGVWWEGCIFQKNWSLLLFCSTGFTLNLGPHVHQIPFRLIY